ncbi:methylated-DNA--[protein]-cysteine S-methyltransferase [candidate division WOR-3 bacterium]|nr:methylated-DNA--[protein]-cysteine S-methyltransferase [candidate division WOR-3 bacterium]
MCEQEYKIKSILISYRIVQSQFGEVGIVWKMKNKDAMITRVFLPESGKKIKYVIKKVYPDAVFGSVPIINKICKKLGNFLKGKPIEFSLNNIDLKQLYNFQKKVLLVERQIPYGWVSTYGRLAKKIGVPRASRAVGQALARNPFPIIIPCHRTIRSDGSLGGFQGGLKLKRKLLEIEGIQFNRKGKVIIDKVW